ncbi:hypothetical protein GCM10009017_26380 [Halarchaeum rubridurum]|uniref:Uncharacterized protein n=1 Tax=Halarchaeum rubridurum TaxID=489911 RepID=A0A830G4N3_9EURY|nr:hypothetical protein GCM10009017_26380 [Halarchaeum rubridurum]
MPDSPPTPPQELSRDLVESLEGCSAEELRAAERYADALAEYREREARLGEEDQDEVGAVSTSCRTTFRRERRSPPKKSTTTATTTGSGEGMGCALVGGDVLDGRVIVRCRVIESVPAHSVEEMEACGVDTKFD